MPLNRPAKSDCWEQFVYDSDPQSTQPSLNGLLIQYWLQGYCADSGGSNCTGAEPSFSCPALQPPGGTPWKPYGGDCYADSYHLPVAAVPVAQLASLSLRAYSNYKGSGNDVATLCVSQGVVQCAHSFNVTEPDGVLGLNNSWTAAEFNIFGSSSDAPTAIFNNQAIIAVSNALTDALGNPVATTCQGPMHGGDTGELNNLNLSPCSVSGSGIVFTEDGLYAAPISPSTPAALDLGQSLTGHASLGKRPYTYQWSTVNSDGSLSPISGATQSTYSPPTSGNFEYCVTDAVQVQVCSTPDVVTVNPAFSGTSVTISAPVQVANMPQTMAVSWTAGAGTTPYSVQLYTSPDASCTETDPAGISGVTSKSSATFDVSPPYTTTYCASVTDSASIPETVTTAGVTVTVASSTQGVPIGGFDLNATYACDEAIASCYMPSCLSDPGNTSGCIVPSCNLDMGEYVGPNDTNQASWNFGAGGIYVCSVGFFDLTGTGTIPGGFGVDVGQGFCCLYNGVNQGTINIESGGYLFIAGPNFLNSGTINIQPGGYLVDNGYDFVNKGTINIQGVSELTTAPYFLNEGTINDAGNSVAMTMSNEGIVALTTSSPTINQLDISNVFGGSVIIAAGGQVEGEINTDRYSSLTIPAGAEFYPCGSTNRGQLVNNGILDLSSTGNGCGGRLANYGNFTDNGLVITGKNVFGAPVIDNYGVLDIEASFNNSAFIINEMGGSVKANAEFDNYGELNDLGNLTSDSTFMNVATSSFQGTLNIQNFYGEGNFFNMQSLVNAGGIINVDGALWNIGSIQNQGVGYIENDDNINDSGSIAVNSGFFWNFGNLTVQATGSLTNAASLLNYGMIINNGATGIITNQAGGMLVNEGAAYGIYNYAVFKNNAGATFQNQNTFTNALTFSNEGLFNDTGGDNVGSLLNSGMLTNDGLGMVKNSGTFSNSPLGTITNVNQVTNNCCLAWVDNSGTMTNQAIVTNNATITIDGTVANSGNFTNYDFIDNFGNFTNQAPSGMLNNDPAADFTNEAGATLTDYGTLMDDGTIENLNGSFISSIGTFDLVANDTSTLQPFGKGSGEYDELDNYGSMTIGSTGDTKLFRNEAGVTLINDGTITILGTLDNGGIVENGGEGIFGQFLGQTPGRIINRGLFYNDPSAKVTNDAGSTVLNYAFTNSAGVAVANTGVVYNLLGALLTNLGMLANGQVGFPPGTLSNYGMLNNGATDSNSATLTNAAGSSLNNNNILMNYATSYNYATLSNYAALTNQGTLNNGSPDFPSATLTDFAGSSLNNAGTLTNLGMLANGQPGNSGISILVTLTNSGTLSNGVLGNKLASLTNYAGFGLDNTGTLDNYAKLTNLGMLANGQPGNSGILNNYGMLNNGATDSNSATLTNELTNAAGSYLVNVQGATLTNYATLTNQGYFNDGSSLDMTVSTLNNEVGSMLNNLGALTVNGDFVNQGVLNNGASDSDSATLTINAGYTLTNVDTAKVTNYATLTNEGTLSNGAYLGDTLSSLTDKAGSTLNNYATLKNFASLNNQGTLNNGSPDFLSASLTDLGGSSLNNAGTLTNLGMLTNGQAFTIGKLTNSGTFNNGSPNVTSATLTNLVGFNLTNSGTFKNYGTLNNCGMLTNQGMLTNGQVGVIGTTLANSGILNNLATLTNLSILTNGNAAFAGTLTNSGTLNNGDTVTTSAILSNSAGSTLNNNKIITNYARLTNQGTFMNGNSIVPGVLTTLGTFTNGSPITTGGSLTNAAGSTITAQGPITNYASIVNAAKATINNNMNIHNVPPSGQLTNHGTLNDGGGVLDNEGTVSNDGTINVDSTGSIDNDGNMSNLFNGVTDIFGTLNNEANGTIDNAGTIILESGSLFNSSAGSSYIGTPPTIVTTSSSSSSSTVATGVSEFPFGFGLAMVVAVLTLAALRRTQVRTEDI